MPTSPNTLEEILQTYRDQAISKRDKGQSFESLMAIYLILLCRTVQSHINPRLFLEEF
ncbi:MAG: hypothetical protein FWD57_06320 [Polyangiaceae bacterium]|nr:hypothetical protein [Polyangiaceae bacterium]